MPTTTEIYTLHISVPRGGSVSEAITFLQDLEYSYNKLYLFYRRLDYFDLDNLRFGKLSPLFYKTGGFPFSVYESGLSLDSILPEDALSIYRIKVSSPGFWEFLGSLNPLQQIREYLNDRHKRRQDKEYREKSEQERLALENELIQRQVLEKDNSILKDRIGLMRELGFSNKEIRNIIWENMGKPLTILAKHQDNGLIEKAQIIIRKK